MSPQFDKTAAFLSKPRHHEVHPRTKPYSKYQNTLCAVVACAAVACGVTLASVQPRQQTQRLLPECQRGADAAEQLWLWQDLPDEHSFNCNGLPAVWDEEEGVVVRVVYVRVGSVCSPTCIYASIKSTYCRLFTAGVGEVRCPSML